VAPHETLRPAHRAAGGEPHKSDHAGRLIDSIATSEKSIGQVGRAASAPRRRAPLLSPTLTKALSELAATEGLPLRALVAVLLNEALDHRSRP
jgi:hypothetical protein